MREIVLDTETTGLDPQSGHRLVEIGCVEMHGRVRTGRTFQAYLNPERDMPQEAFNVHGLSNAFLADKPLFADVAARLLEFIDDSPLIIHNAAFDLGFLNHELDRAGFPGIDAARAVDTVVIARRKFPGSPAKLDALCKRFSIDTSSRTKHGALLDAELLADVYLELMGGRQAALLLAAGPVQEKATSQDVVASALPPRSFPPSSEELAAHKAFLRQIKNPLWTQEESGKVA
jgi:DNA polymerase III subunit epsilon